MTWHWPEIVLDCRCSGKYRTLIHRLNLTNQQGEIMMKDKAINILTAELSALPVLIMTYYALTAKPTGQWQLTFSLPVYWLISSDLLAYPWLLTRIPRLRHNPLKMNSLALKASSRYNCRLNERVARWDDEMNLAIFLLERGCLMLLSEPLLLGDLGYHSVRRLWYWWQ